MKHFFRKRMGALLLAVVVGMTSLGTVTTAAAKEGSASEHFIDFSFPFDFLFFHFGEDEKTMTKEELEAERDHLREVSMMAEKAAGFQMVYEYQMETPQMVSTLDLSVCKGAGTFAFADPQFVPEKGVSVCEVIFTPAHVQAFDYEQMLGWDAVTQTLRRYVEVTCMSFLANEEEVKIEAEIMAGSEIVPEDADIPEAAPDGEMSETVPEVTPGDAEQEATPQVTPSETAPETIPGETKPETTPQVTPSEDTPETLPQVTPGTTQPDTLPEDNTAADAVDKIPENVPETNKEGVIVSRPMINLIPEINSIPELVTPSATPEPTPTPKPYVTAPIMQGILAETGVPIIEKDDKVKAFETAVLGLPQDADASEVMAQMLSLTREYESMTGIQKNAVGSDVLAKLEELQAQMAVYNHESNGVTVSGSIPWFVQLRVALGNDTDTYVPTGLETIVPYEMCLWNLLTDSEYVLGGGQKVTLSMAVPEAIHLYDGLTIVHYMDETHYEYIELQIVGDTLSFETASFSPFNIAGSTVLVGGKTETNTSGSNSSVSNKEDAKPTPKPSGNSDSRQETQTQNRDNGKDDKNKQESTSSGTAVKTGDSSAVSQFVIIALGAVILILLCVLVIKRSRKTDESEDQI